MRYFIETSYKGTAYSGFQVQKNSNTIQAEIEKALQIYFKQSFVLTGSSRTDAGVHALQNYFHFDAAKVLFSNYTTEGIEEGQLAKSLYNLNAILPRDIVIKRIFAVADNAHCRFDALSREYQYFIYKKKDPFLADRAYYFPYSTNLEKLRECADIVLSATDFTSFSKRNTQVDNFICNIKRSGWREDESTLVYTVEANRFLRGMVKALVGTMLRAGTQKISVNEFGNVIKSRDCIKADFSVPSHGLFLTKVAYNGQLLSGKN
jgi:tRNA pseudouridine38-40 synthase